MSFSPVDIAGFFFLYTAQEATLLLPLLPVSTTRWVSGMASKASVIYREMKMIL
jgi:hypothetical protein